MPRTQLNNLDYSGSIPFEFELIAPPPEVAQLVNTFFVVRTDQEQLDEVMPAYSAQVMIYVEGSSRLTVETGESFSSDTVTCTAPLLGAAPFTMHGPVTIIGASLTPLGWHCLSQKPADKVNNCVVPASDVFTREEIAKLEGLSRQYRNGGASTQDLCDAIARSLHDRQHRLNAVHVEFVHTVIDWLSSALSPPISDLYSRLTISERSAQRLCKRYFGVSPSHLLKRYRAIRAAMLLANPQLSQAMRDEIVGAYFDQAHLIHDVRRYTGRTPGGLRMGSALKDTLDPEAHGEAAKILR